MTADERLALIRVKLERAKKHIADLQSEVKAYLSVLRYNNVISQKTNPQTRELTYYVLGIPDVPVIISAIAGDALHNIRSTLDHLAYQLVLAAGGTPTKDTGFPISGSAAKFISGKVGKVKGMRQDAIDLIDTIEPYEGGSGENLWYIHALNNIDKHRLLLTVGCANPHRSITKGERAQLEKGFRGSYGRDIPFPYPEGHPLMVHSDRPFVMLKAGYELLTVPDSEVDQNLQFTLDITLSEPGIVESQPVAETLNSMANIVDGVVSDFAPLLV